MIVAVLGSCSTAGTSVDSPDREGAGPKETESESPDGPSRSRKSGSAKESERQAGLLMAAPQRALDRCRTLPSHRAVCPASVPRIERGTPLRVQAFSQVGGHRLVSLEWSAPYPGVSRKNSPPRFAHVVVQSGSGSSAFPFEVPSRSSEGPIPLSRGREPLRLDRPRWGGRRGTLLLAPSFPDGGVHGDHLVFLWRRPPLAHAVSLHAWPPLSETERTLRAIVESIDD
jgi:hypothetical protein